VGGTRGGGLRLYNFSWRLLTCIRICPQRLVCLYSPCAPVPGLRRHGTAHPEAAARSTCVHISIPHRVSCLLTLNSLVIFHLFFPFPALVLWVCGHVLLATCSSTSSWCASPHVLRIGLGGAGNRRGLACCAGFWSLL
jgi:hypothetical protein